MTEENDDIGFPIYEHPTKHEHSIAICMNLYIKDGYWQVYNSFGERVSTTDLELNPIVEQYEYKN